MKRYVFLISDGTGITVQAFGQSLISQFENIEFEQFTLPYIDSLDKAKKVVQQINQAYDKEKIKPLVFMTLINSEITNYLKTANSCSFDLFNTFIAPLEEELKEKFSYRVGRAHGMVNTKFYSHRLEAVDFALLHDDGLKVKGYDKADIILIGVSRCGKTPSCLYMALQYGILAANYPFTEEDMTGFMLPKVLRPYKNKLFGLTIDVERLCQIRTERRPNSKYASLEQCIMEVNKVKAMYQKEKISFIDSTNYSIEEISTKILSEAGLQRKI